MANRIMSVTTSLAYNVSSSYFLTGPISSSILQNRRMMNSSCGIGVLLTILVGTFIVTPPMPCVNVCHLYSVMVVDLEDPWRPLVRPPHVTSDQRHHDKNVLVNETYHRRVTRIVA